MGPGMGLQFGPQYIPMVYYIQHRGPFLKPRRASRADAAKKCPEVTLLWGCCSLGLATRP